MLLVSELAAFQDHLSSGPNASNSLLSQLQIQDVCVCACASMHSICANVRLYEGIWVFVWLEEGEVDHVNANSAWFLELSQPI